jgi:hypothetical protein
MLCNANLVITLRCSKVTNHATYFASQAHKPIQ